ISSGDRNAPFYATSSAGLASDVRDLLLRLGITARIHEKSFRYRGGRRAGYTVGILGDGAAFRFLQRIGPHCVGREKAIAALQSYLGVVDKRLTCRDTVPCEVVDLVDEERRRQQLTWTELAD